MPPSETEIALLKQGAENTKEEFRVVWAAIDRVRERLTALEVRVALIVGAGTALNAIITAIIVNRVKGG